MPKKKKKKIRKLSVSKKLLKEFRADAGKGFENFNKVFRINVFDEARKIKDYKQLERFIETYAAGMAASDVAVAAAKYARDNWKVIKILKDPDYRGAILELLQSIANKNAKRIFNSQTLKRFCKLTGYKKPSKQRTFQNDVTMFKEYFGIKRIHHTYEKESKEDKDYEKNMLKKLNDPEWIKKKFTFGSKT